MRVHRAPCVQIWLRCPCRGRHCVRLLPCGEGALMWRLVVGVFYTLLAAGLVALAVAGVLLR